MNLVQKLVGAAILVALLGGGAVLAQDKKEVKESIKTTYDNSFAFNKVKSYSWEKVQTTDPMVEPRLAAAVDGILQGMGWHLVDKNPSLEVSAVDLNSSTGYARFYRSMTGYSWRRGWANGSFADDVTSVRRITPGTLVVDMYNPTDKKLVWRGMATEPTQAKEKTKEDDVDTSVKTMFAKFPPKSGGKMAPNEVEVPASPSSTTTTGTLQ